MGKDGIPEDWRLSSVGDVVRELNATLDECARRSKAANDYIADVAYREREKIFSALGLSDDLSDAEIGATIFQETKKAVVATEEVYFPGKKTITLPATEERLEEINIERTKANEEPLKSIYPEETLEMKIGWVEQAISREDAYRRVYKRQASAEGREVVDGYRKVGGLCPMNEAPQQPHKGEDLTSV